MENNSGRNFHPPWANLDDSFNSISLYQTKLTLFFPIFSFEPPWKHQKLWFSYVFRAIKTKHLEKRVKFKNHWFNPLHATGLFLYPLKTWENQRFSDVFRRHRKRPVAWNGLTWEYNCFIWKISEIFRVTFLNQKNCWWSLANF